MNKKKKIFITGCAKTGSTLLRRLFNAFEGLNVCCVEISYHHFIASDYNVGKRTISTVFSTSLDEKTILHQLQELKSSGVKIINIVRNKIDVLASDGGYVSEKRYDHSTKQALKYKDYISHTIHYEDLVEDPDSEQEKIKNLFGLTVKHKWSDYPNFMDLQEEAEASVLDKTTSKIYKLRPIQKK